jgi:hypothetical protein
MTDLTTFDGTRLALTIHGPAGAPTIVLVHSTAARSQACASSAVVTGAVVATLGVPAQVIVDPVEVGQQAGDLTPGLGRQAQPVVLPRRLREGAPATSTEVRPSAAR